MQYSTVRCSVTRPREGNRLARFGLRELPPDKELPRNNPRTTDAAMTINNSHITLHLSQLLPPSIQTTTIQMKVNIRISGGTSFSVTVPDNSTVQDLRTAALVAAPIDLISTRSQTPYKLIYSGKKLDLGDTLTSLGVTDASTVFMVSSDTNTHSPILTPAELNGSSTNNPSPLSQIAKDDTGATATAKITKVRRKSANKRRCSYLNCTSTPLRMVGDCVHCQGKFCSKHRLLENHHCTELQTCKEQMHERNANKLTSEQTIASKV